MSLRVRAIPPDTQRVARELANDIRARILAGYDFEDLLLEAVFEAELRGEMRAQGSEDPTLIPTKLLETPSLDTTYSEITFEQVGAEDIVGTLDSTPPGTQK